MGRSRASEGALPTLPRDSGSATGRVGPTLLGSLQPERGRTGLWPPSGNGRRRGTSALRASLRHSELVLKLVQVNESELETVQGRFLSCSTEQGGSALPNGESRTGKMHYDNGRRGQRGA
jgi:hypothetical protein